MSPADFDFLAGFLKARSGLVLHCDKLYLVESRLVPVARRNGLASLGDLVTRLRGGADRALATAVVEAMTTNESFFFRDKLPFEHLVEVMLPQLMQARAAEKRLRLWCAAASTGQEPYSIVMAMKERVPQLASWRVEILGTDLNTDVLDRARQGLYTQFEVQRGLPIQLLLKYFEKKGELWEISPAIRSLVALKPFNLLESFAALGRFDIVFCRNVLIYFDQPTKADVLDRLARVTAPDGFLVLGAAETVLGLTASFELVANRNGLYRPACRPAASVPLRQNAALAATG